MAESHQVANSELPMRGSHEIESELKLLRDQVDLLQISTSKREKPWYKEISSIISILAILLSGLTFVYSQFSQNAEEIRSKQKELSETLAALIDLRKDLQLRITSIVDPQIRETEAVILNNKRLIDLETADSLVTQIPTHVSSSEYGVLGTESYLDSNFVQSERYYKAAIDNSHTDISKIFSIRALAIFYFSPGPLRDFGKGRKYFGDAVEVVKNPTDPYMVYTLGATYEQWGLNELGNGFQMEGKQMIEHARKYYLDLPDSPQKDLALDLLGKRTTPASTTGAVPPNPMLQPTPLQPSR